MKLVWQKPKLVGQLPHQLNRKLHPWSGEVLPQWRWCLQVQVLRFRPLGPGVLFGLGEVPPDVPDAFRSIVQARPPGPDVLVVFRGGRFTAKLMPQGLTGLGKIM